MENYMDENGNYINGEAYYHIFTNGGRDSYAGTLKAANRLFDTFVRLYGCARIYIKAKGEFEDDNGECIRSKGGFPS